MSTLSNSTENIEANLKKDTDVNMTDNIQLNDHVDGTIIRIINDGLEFCSYSYSGIALEPIAIM